MMRDFCYILLLEVVSSRKIRNRAAIGSQRGDIQSGMSTLIRELSMSEQFLIA